jgi:superfamily II DNA helicase RecQ
MLGGFNSYSGALNLSSDAVNLSSDAVDISSDSMHHPMPPSTSPEPAPHETSPEPPSSAMPSLQPVSMLNGLRKLYGTNAQWSCAEQRDSVKALVELKQDVIVALRTGIGKTAVALLPSIVESGYTVIIIPLIALMEDWKRRLTQLNIKFEHFRGVETQSLQGHADIILVSSDVAKYDHWKRCIAELNRKRPVVRFVIDEAHYYFTDINFRSHAMANSFALRTLPVQMVLMSGTIPPNAEHYLKKQFVLKNPITIRTQSSRREIAYVRDQPASDLDSMLHQFTIFYDKYKQKETWDEDRDRYLIFTPHLEEGAKIANRLGLEFYHANSKGHPITAAERQEIYQRWTSGTYKGLVATTALAAGNDYPHVRITAHIGSPFDMVTFAQQSGRAGRDGQRAVSYLVVKKYAAAASRKGDDGDMSGREAMQMYSQHSASDEDYPNCCLRYKMSQFLDRVGHGCLEFGGAAELCSVCLLGKDRIL